MTITSAENKTFNYVLRAVQVIFAIIVMGTDGYGMQHWYILLYGQTIDSDSIA